MNLAVVDICILAVVLLGGAWGLAMGLTKAVVGPLALLMAIPRHLPLSEGGSTLPAGRRRQLEG